MDISFCDRCDGSIPSGDRKNGAARQEGGLLLCARCLRGERRRKVTTCVLVAGLLLLAAALGALAAQLLLGPRIDDLRAETDALRSDLSIARQQAAGAANDRGEIGNSVVRLADAVTGLKGAIEKESERTAGELEDLSARLREHAREVARVKRFAEALAQLATEPAPTPTVETWVEMAASADAGARLTALVKLEGVEDQRIAGIVTKALSDPEAVIRAQGSAMAGRRGLQACLPRLAQLLEDESDHVRDAADVALETLAGVDFGFDATAPESERKEAIDRIAGWLEDRDS